jgi:hypothetical protein
MTDLTLVKRIGAGFAAFAIAGGLALAGTGVASAHEGEDHGDSGSSSSESGTPGKIHGLVSDAPMKNAADAVKDVPLVGTAVGGFAHHTEMEHEVPLGDYVKENTDDPVGYSVGSHIDMTEDMLGAPGAFDDEQEMLGATPDE